MFKQVLIATDGSPAALLAARVGGELCSPTGSVRLVHVTSGLRDLAAMGFDSASNVIGGAMGDLRERVQLEESGEAARLLEQSRAAIPAGPSVETHERTGRPAAVILEEAERSDVDTVVLGSRGRGALARALFGSVADAVARGTTRPVLIARNLVARKILVALDGSEPSLRAAQAAALVAQRLGGEIRLLTVADVPVKEADREFIVSSVRTSSQPLVTHVRTAIAALAPGVKVEERFVLNEAAVGILEEAVRVGAELIVLGRRGWTNNARLPLGTVAQRVMTHADASVLVVP